MPGEREVAAGAKSHAIDVQLLKVILPELSELIAEIRNGPGFLNLPAQAIRSISEFHTVTWAQFYEREHSIKVLSFASMVGPEALPELIDELKTLSSDERAQLRNDIKKEILNLHPPGTRIEIPTPEDMEESISEIMAKGPDVAGQWRTISTSFFMCSIFTYLAIMTFGRSMHALVAAAKAGDDVAFCHAVQIDRTVLFAIPYFRERLIRAQVGCEPNFLAKLANAIKGRILGRKLEYPTLMLAFAILDDEGLLNMPLEQLMDVCQELGLYGKAFGVEDVDSLRKRRQYYLKRSGRQKAF